MSSLNGWHPGERSILKKLHYEEASALSYTWIDGSLPEQHRVFHSTRLPFVPVTSIDAEGRPWSSILAGADGKPGFITSPNDEKLNVDAKLWEGDPLVENLKQFSANEDPKKRFLVAGIGIEFSTRRRNKFAGWMESVKGTDADLYRKKLHLKINQAIGNCPKYINIRDLVPHSTSPVVAQHKTHLSQDDRLPDELRSFILTSDTVFLGTTYKAKNEDAQRFPSHVGMNQRGGRQGFIRVLPSDGRTVVLPDFSGNRIMTSLGNIEATPLASMSFIDFTTGDILYLTGTAKNLVGAEAQKLMPRQNVLTAMYVTGYTFVRDALPVRQREGSIVERSPYSPPVRVLAEEKQDETTFDDITVTLKRIDILSNNLATFTLAASQKVQIKPGQTAILDFTDLFGKSHYRHMAPGQETSINDDRIRTWTVSSAHLDPQGTDEFALTMREKEGGLVTGALFKIARQLSIKMPSVLKDTSPLKLQVRLIGIGGEFTLEPGKKKLLWIAGGIGITPFLSMLSALSLDEQREEYDIALVLSTREPEVLLPLIKQACQSGSGGALPSHIRLSLDVYTSSTTPTEFTAPGVTTFFHKGRLDEDVLSRLEVATRTVYLCGPQEFETAALAALVLLGVPSSQVVQEGFAY